MEKKKIPVITFIILLSVANLIFGFFSIIDYLGFGWGIDEESFPTNMALYITISNSLSIISAYVTHKRFKINALFSLTPFIIAFLITLLFLQIIN